MNAELISAAHDRMMTPLHDVLFPPAEIRLCLISRKVELVWQDGTISRLSFAYLRHRCGCATCACRRRAGLSPDYDPSVDVMAIEPVGSVGLQFVFSDGHNRGIFPWRFLRSLDEIPTTDSGETVA